MKPRRTKIVGTIGPASSSPEMIAKLIDAGLNVTRLNFSHLKDPAEMAARVDTIRRIAKEKGVAIAILQDLQGPKIRTERFEHGQIELVEGQKFIITSDDVMGNEERVSTTYKELPLDVVAGQDLLLDDGNLRLRIEKIIGNDIHTVVIYGGTLKDKKGINVPDANLSTPAVTDKDIEDIKTGVELGVDWVAMSFVRTREDVLIAKEHLRRAGSKAKLMAKIEKPSAVEPEEFARILEIVDGVMVARGDLGVELEPEKVPMIQKMIIQMCRDAGKPVVTATQMLESMIDNPRPTRAEASDVANAILDGTDAVMLSAESASGKYPVEAVTMMDKIARTTESSSAYQKTIDGHPEALHTTQDAIALAACEVADTIDAPLVCFTDSGSSLWRLSRNRPRVPIIALTRTDRAKNQLVLSSNVTSDIAADIKDTDHMVELAREAALKSNLVVKGDKIVIVAGVPFGQTGSTNLIRVEQV
jgi:pyruvate kinase